jgi:hypothetical protein
MLLGEGKRMAGKTSRQGLGIKRILKKSLPAKVLRLRRELLSGGKYRNLTTQQVFTKVYEDYAWGRPTDPMQKFFSGSGSHHPDVVGAYVKAVGEFLGAFEKRPDVVDLGCGDFFVGSQVRHLCDQYVACDIVEPLIKFNRVKYKSLDVDFRVLDLTKDELPGGEVVFLRQVLQHLSNATIGAALPRLISKYKYLVLTEHLPAEGGFVHNLDKPSGPDVRVGFKSGLVLTSAPFNLRVLEERCLCEVADRGDLGGVIRTNLYRLG